ncbi:MAG: hypothetical protein IKR41_12475 [Bacteroidales bacterium]|nr:hypothetical protein [Bacteroidales bacterium]
MKRNFKKVEDFKNLPKPNVVNDFSAVEGLDILMSNELNNVTGGKVKVNPETGNVCNCIFKAQA